MQCLHVQGCCFNALLVDNLLLAQLKPLNPPAALHGALRSTTVKIKEIHDQALLCSTESKLYFKWYLQGFQVIGHMHVIAHCENFFNVKVLQLMDGF